MKVVNYPTMTTDRTNFQLNYLLLKFKSRITEENYRLTQLSAQSNTKTRSSYNAFVGFHVILFIICLISYLLTSQDGDESGSMIFKLILIISLILTNLTLLLLPTFFLNYCQKKSFYFELNYFISCIFLILNSNPFQYYAFNHSNSSIPTTLSISALIVLNRFSLAFNYRSLFISNVSICTFHGILTIIFDPSSETILQNCILYSLCTYHIIDCYLEELAFRTQFIVENKESLKEAENNRSSLEENEPSLNILNCIEELRNTTPFIAKKPKDTVERVISALKVIQKTIEIQDSNYENFEEDMDEDDKIYIQQSCLPNKISEPIKQKKFKQRLTLENIVEKILGQEAIIMLKQISVSWNIDMFSLNEKCGNMPVTVVGRYCMKLYNLTENLGIAELKLNFFLNEIQKNYKNNPYHNAIHAADVLASGLYLLKNSDLFSNLLDIEMLTVILSHLAHDVGHPGFNNRFLINFNDELALTYNDISVLESMHASMTFKILQDKDKNILESLSKSQYLMVRKWVVELILATDMAKHFDLIVHFRSKGYKAKDMVQPESKLEALKLLIHSADIGHTAKETELHRKWTKVLADEFYHQGDVEKEAKVPVSMFCDRETTILSKSQMGFLKNIAMPLFELLCGFLNSKLVQENCLDQLKSNAASWEFEYSSGKLQTLRITDISQMGNEVNSPPGMLSFKSMAFKKAKY